MTDHDKDIHFLSLKMAWPTHVGNHQAHVEAHWLFHRAAYIKRHTKNVPPIERHSRPFTQSVSFQTRQSHSRANRDERFIDEHGFSPVLD